MRERDKGWVRGLFGQTAFKPNMKGEQQTEYTDVNSSFADTTIGGNQAINPLPQFTHIADPKRYGYLARMSGGEVVQNGQAGSYGMGRWYGENVNDYAHYAHFRFGTPRYIGLLSFLTTMHNPDLARLTSDGMFSSFFRTAGSITAYAGLFVVLGPSIGIPLLVGTKIIDMFLDTSVSKYWYVKPQMHLYLQAVQSMLDNQLVHARLVPFTQLFDSGKKDATEEGSKVYGTMNEVYDALPNIWKSNGKFDVFKMVNRYQILHDIESRMMKKFYEDANGNLKQYESSVEGFVNKGKVRDYMTERADMNNIRDKNNKSVTALEAITNSYINSADYQVNAADDVAKGMEAVAVKQRANQMSSGISKELASDNDNDQIAQLEKEQKEAQEANKPVITKLADLAVSTFEAFRNSSFGTQAIAELHDGAQWITFRVDGKGSVNDSFGNTTTEPQIASAINGISSQARALDMNLSGGVTGFTPLDGVTKAVNSFIAGGLDSLNLSGITGVFGKSSVDIPEMWDSSSADIATESYTIQLRSPYGNDISRFQNLTVPLCFILAGCLPMATGKQTYRNPFYCEVISRGRNTIRNGMITNVSITRGAGNMGWRGDGVPLGIDVTITVKDLSKVVAMPLLKDARLFADDNMYTDYMATLGGASLHDLTYTLSKMTLNANIYKQSWKSYFMEGRITNSIMAFRAPRLIANFVTGTARN